MGDTNIIISSDLRFNRLWEGKKIDIAHLSYIHKNQLIWWMDEHMNSQRKSGVVHKTLKKTINRSGENALSECPYCDG